MTYNLFDDEARFRLLPFTHTRPIADIRCGILTMRERWELLLSSSTGTWTTSYLNAVFPIHKSNSETCLINARVFATSNLCQQINQLQSGQKLMHGDTIIAAVISETNLDYNNFNALISSLNTVAYDAEIQQLSQVWDIFTMNGKAIHQDFDLVTANRKSVPIPEMVTVVGAEKVFIEEGAIINAGCIINATTGPIYLAKKAEVLEGCMLRGPIALGENAVLKMGAKVYGETTIGPGCKVGGELSNVVFFANSNKGHDGYLGNAIIGEWCNLGADTNCSNLKNNYDMVKIWDEHTNKPIRTGTQFCGLMMGDHSKCGINTMFNTGTVVGVSANIYGGDFQEKFIPSFSWGSAQESETYNFKKAMDTAKRMMSRRGCSLSEEEMEMFQYVFDATAAQRAFWNTKKDN